jgi:hypothetical protein
LRVMEAGAREILASGSPAGFGIPSTAMPCLKASRCPQLAADAHVACCDTGVPSLLLEGFAQSSRSLTRVPLKKCTKGWEGRKPEEEVIIVKVSSVQGMAPLPLPLFLLLSRC